MTTRRTPAVRRPARPVCRAVATVALAAVAVLGAGHAAGHATGTVAKDKWPRVTTTSTNV